MNKQASQSTSHVLMIRPLAFRSNEQTQRSNTFQKQRSLNSSVVAQQALQEFDAYVDMLRSEGVNVIVVDADPEKNTPDALFPNNWISFHEDGHVFLYPMLAENRRAERRTDILQRLKDEGFGIIDLIDLSPFEKQGKFLEGTGSMVLDRINKIAYACLSPRTDQDVLAQFCRDSGYHAQLFRACDEQNQPIYHTNVMMCVGSYVNLICLESVQEGSDKQALLKQLHQSGKELLTLTPSQMNQFAGNMLEVRNTMGETILVMSSQAFSSLNDSQIASLSAHCKLVHSPLTTIEEHGGGSARCMLAEIHLPKK